MWDDAHNDGTIGDSTSVLYLILSRNRAGTAYVTDAVCVCVCVIFRSLYIQLQSELQDLPTFLPTKCVLKEK